MKLKAFTLIELLIVVAIIAILAAIAVPNFLEAQTRAKVARVVADMRSVATALETYHIDWNHYPFDRADDYTFPFYLNKGLTTPINYISNGARLEDIFSTSLRTDYNRMYHRYRYRAFKEKWLVPDWGATAGPDTAGAKQGMEVFGAWFLESKGPDKATGPLPVGFVNGDKLNDWLWQLYDASNGTVSKGDVLRGQKGDINSMGYNVSVTYP